MNHIHVLRADLKYLILSAVLCITTAMTVHAQSPAALNFPDTRCDQTSCIDTVIYNHDWGTIPVTILGVELVDSTAYAITQSPAYPYLLPDTSAPPFRLTLCFTPGKRGIVSDSLIVYKQIGNVFDTVRIRLNGRGIGPELYANPSLLNFPKTTSGGTSNGQIVIHNTGDVPYPLVPLPAALNLAPPFALTNAGSLPPQINPGDSVVLRISFNPTSDGVFSVQPILSTYCNSKLQLSISGYTDFAGTGAVLRIAKVFFNPVSADQVGCDSIKCGDITVQNVGSAPLIIDSIKFMNGNVGYGITTTTTLPIVIPPNDFRTLNVCLIISNQRGNIVDTLRIVSNTRNSIAFGLVLDESKSMEEMLNCGASSPRKIDEAITQAQNFVDKTLLDLRTVGVQDEIAIHSYSTRVGTNGPPVIRYLQYLTPVTNPVKIASKAAIATITPTQSTPTGSALIRMIDTLAKSTIPEKVIVLLTDGVAQDDNGTSSQANVIAYARSKGVTIFAIGLFTTATDRTQGGLYLRNIATGTGGQSFDASDCGSLQKAFETITDILSRNTITKDPFLAVKIDAPRLTFGGLIFDSTAVGDSTCKKITITNNGSGDAVIDKFALQDLLGGPQSEFVPGQAIKYPLFVSKNGGILQLNVCFKPQAIRVRRGKGHIEYNSCDGTPKEASLTGVGFTALPLRVTDRRVALPGSIVKMPIYCDSALTLYSVDTITYQVRWNKTMLDVRNVTASGGTTLVGTPTIDFDERYQFVTIQVAGSNIAGGGQIGELEFQVLRGDTLATLVELVRGTFQDGNPRSYLINAGIVAYDSTCFRDFKGVEAGSPSKIVMTSITPTPTRSSGLNLNVVTTDPMSVDIDVFATNGARSVSFGRYDLSAGTTIIGLDLRDLPDGVYYARLRSVSGEITVQRILLAR